MQKIESFNEWLEKRLKEDNRISRRGLLTGVGALASGAFLGSARAANTPAGSPGLPDPEDSVGMIPQVRHWEVIDKKGHMENFDRSFVYIRFTDTPDQLSKIPRDGLSDADKEYVNNHERMIASRRIRGGPGSSPNSGTNPNSMINGSVQAKDFNPNFGPKPSKNATPMQIWKHQFSIIRKSEAAMRVGKRPPVDYVILYRYYDGKMPDPPMDESSILESKKDACYHKVKSRYRVWPSAYSSGALVRCRKVGAKNWGNSKKKKKKMMLEALKNKEDYDHAAQAAMLLHYNGKNVAEMSTQEIMKELHKLNKTPPEGTSDMLFAARVRSVAKETTKPEDFAESTFKLEKERGLKGWFDRNGGKGWIDCKASKKGRLVPCGRKKTGKGADREYPACRPTLSACNAKGKKRKKSSRRISWD